MTSSNSARPPVGVTSGLRKGTMENDENIYERIDFVEGVAPTNDGDRLVIDCRIDGQRRLLAFSADDAGSVALFMIVGTKLCPLLRGSSEQQKSDPIFRTQIRKMMNEMLTQLIDRLTPDDQLKAGKTRKFDA